jgi:hypothetical protein
LKITNIKILTNPDEQKETDDGQSCEQSSNSQHEGTCANVAGQHAYSSQISTANTIKFSDQLSSGIQKLNLRKDANIPSCIIPWSKPQPLHPLQVLG